MRPLLTIASPFSMKLPLIDVIFAVKPKSSLSLYIAKLFLDHKTFESDVNIFLYYIECYFI